MPQQITIRKYTPADAQALAGIFYNTIHLINSQHYSKAQVDVWAPRSSFENPEGWVKKFQRTEPWVALIGNEIVGFAEFEPDGHIDCFYCHHQWLGQGVGSALMQQIHLEAGQKKIARLFSEVSITAKPFFERHGFTTLCEQTILRNGVALNNFKMEKWLNA